MKHYEVKNLKKNLDTVVQYIDEHKLTNAYLNYGLIRNSKIIAKAIEAIDEATPARLKELETKMYQLGVTKFEKLEGKEKKLSAELSEIDKQNKTFNLGYLGVTEEEREERNKLAKEYAEFLNLENDVVFYYLDFEGIKDINIEIQYWDILDNFIK
jgi:hypothetical protein